MCTSDAYMSENEREVVTGYTRLVGRVFPVIVTMLTIKIEVGTKLIMLALILITQL